MQLGKVKEVMIVLELVDGQEQSIILKGAQLKDFEFTLGANEKKRRGRPRKADTNGEMATQATQPGETKKKSKGGQTDDYKVVATTDANGIPLEGLQFVEYTSKRSGKTDIYLVESQTEAGNNRLFFVDEEPSEDGVVYARAPRHSMFGYGFCVPPSKCVPIQLRELQLALAAAEEPVAA